MKCTYQSHNHPSRLESEYCLWLEARRQAGEIQGFKWQHRVELRIEGKFWKYWTADFIVYENDDTTSIHEAKGFNRSDDAFRLKLNICMRNHPNLVVYVNKIRVKFTPAGRVVLRPRTRRAWPKRILRGVQGPQGPTGPTGWSLR